MSPSSAKSLIACAREAGASCPYCAADIVLGDPIMVCQDCGTVHHRACWRKMEQCGSYSCTPARRKVNGDADQSVLKISADELAEAAPLPVVRPGFGAPHFGSAPPPRKSNGRGLAITALVCGLAGIPFCIPGMVAVVFGAFALAGLGGTRRGRGLAISGIVLGIIDTIGWVVLLGWGVSQLGLVADRERDAFLPDAASIKGLDPPLRRAMLANVLIEHRAGLAGMDLSVGSGVILGVDQGEAVVVTNRHVVDDSFGPATSSAADLSTLEEVEVTYFGQKRIAGRVVWTAPDGTDLALVRVRFGGAGDAQAAVWQKARPMTVGTQVFAIGNPHRLGWTHTQGVISQFRTHQQGDRQTRLIQVQVALNPGNSGGGLYDREGYLIGINSIGQDKSVSEGIGFAIPLDVLLDFTPPDLAAIAPGAAAAPAAAQDVGRAAEPHHPPPESARNTDRSESVPAQP